MRMYNLLLWLPGDGMCGIVLIDTLIRNLYLTWLLAKISSLTAKSCSLYTKR